MMKLTSHKARAGALAGAVVPAAVTLTNKYAKLGMTEMETALVVTALTALATFMIVYLVPNKEKAQ